MLIGEYIKYKRQAMGYSQQQLAELLAVSKQAISKWESDAALPDIMMLPALSLFLNVTPEFLAKAIWMASSGNPITHFVNLFVHEKNGESYLLKTYETADFFAARKKYDDIYAKKDTNALEKILDYYRYDPTRTFTMEIREAFTAKVNDEYCDSFLEALLIESCVLDSIVQTGAVTVVP